MTISVVMAVYNGAAQLRPTIDSILGQTETDFEVIVVDDGSTDATPAILAEYGRLRVIRQENAGLTRALVRGCAEAKGDVIARHDCGDRSHRERLAKQLALINAGNVLVSCAVRYLGPGGEHLYTVSAAGDDVRRSLLNDVPPRIHGIPHHGSAMFTRRAYDEAGGYRPQFRFAQDLDLWIRMAPLGTIGIAPEELYEASIDEHAISSEHRDAQLRLTAIAVALRAGDDEARLLAEAANVRSAPRARRETEAASYYFIAKCLRQQRNPVWRKYLMRALRRNPLHVKAWLSLVQR